jgi:hypothetical protein
MGPFEPADSANVPSVVRQYEAARRRWVALAYDPARASDPAWGEFAQATDTLRKRVKGQGGRWEVGGLIYHLAARGGIGIEQAPTADDQRALGELDAGPGDSEVHQGSARRIGRRPVRGAERIQEEKHHGIGIEQATATGDDRAAGETDLTTSGSVSDR